ncbi:hypothetical protein B484DRAFT_50731 [Ochromonadaceae sp. CCMP2298]|nr:hypothetical protein B484DRAFT_50731 [Ochromonadaceae sp. CCMP2298]
MCLFVYVSLLIRPLPSFLFPAPPSTPILLTPNPYPPSHTPSPHPSSTPCNLYICALIVKFYTLDDSVMFLLNRVETGNMGMGMGGGGSMGGGGGGRGMGGMGGGMGGGGGGMGGGMGGSSGALSSLRLNLQGHSSSPTINALGNLGNLPSRMPWILPCCFALIPSLLTLTHYHLHPHDHQCSRHWYPTLSIYIYNMCIYT